MTIKDILVYADGNASAGTRLDLAAALAKRTGARLTALHASPPLQTPVAPPFVANMAIELQENYRSEAAARARAVAEDSACRTGVTIDWRHLQGNPARAMTSMARMADLAVLSQTVRTPQEHLDLVPVPEEVVMQLSCPLLVVPNDYVWPTVASRVVIAWKDKREAARAVHDALPLLRLAESVTIVEVVEEAQSKELAPGADLARHLAHHDVNVTVASLVGDDSRAGDLILTEVYSQGANLLVMGAYGHARMREFVLGGVTRQVLRSAPVPVLLSH